MKPMKSWPALLIAFLLLATPAAQTEQAPVVYTAEVDGIIQPVVAEYLRRAVEQAGAANAELLVITLRTPGGLLDFLARWSHATAS